MSDYSKLEAWKKAHALTVRLYRETATFPKAELFGLTSQIRRAASSVGANRRGLRQSGRRRLHRFIGVSLGSSSELDYHLVLTRDLGYLVTSTAAEVRGQNGEVARMLKGLLKTVKARITEQRSSSKVRT